MKTFFKYSLILSLTLGFTVSHAQQFLIGMKGGMQMYAMRFVKEESRQKFDSQFQLGYKVGGAIIFPLAERFSFGTELYYSKKGRKYLFDNTTMNVARYKFIELSSYLRKSYKLEFGENTYPGFFFFNVGPNIMYWVNGKGSIEDAYSFDYDVIFSKPVDADFTKNYIDGANRWLFGLDFGIGINFLSKSNQDVFIEFRYTHGHTYLGEGKSTISFLGFDDDLRAQYRVFHISVAYLFDIDLRNMRKGKSTIRRR